MQAAFRYAVIQFNRINETGRKFELQAFVDVINTADTYKLSRLSKSPSRFNQLIMLAHSEAWEICFWFFFFFFLHVCVCIVSVSVRGQCCFCWFTGIEAW